MGVRLTFRWNGLVALMAVGLAAVVAWKGRAGQVKKPIFPGRAADVEVPDVVEEVCLRDWKDPADGSDDVTVADWDGTSGVFDENIAWIEAHPNSDDPKPRMPSLVVEFAEPQKGRVLEARLEVNYVRGNGVYPKRNQPGDRVRVPYNGFQRGDANNQIRFFLHPDWKREIETEGFFGGEARVLYQILDTKRKIVGRGKLSFRIGGRNPSDEICKRWIEVRPLNPKLPRMPFMYAVAKHESKAKNKDNVYYNQFYELPRHVKDVGRPVWHNDGVGMPGGYGIFQVTGSALNSLDNVPRRMIWNWQDNVAGAFEIMEHTIKEGLAQRFFSSIKKSVGEKVYQACPPPKIKVGSYQIPAKRAIWITAYNGWGGPINKRFVYQKGKPCGLGRTKRWFWNPPIKPSGKTYLELILEEVE